MKFHQALADKKIYFLISIPVLVLSFFFLIQKMPISAYADDLAQDMHVLTSFQEPPVMSQGERTMRALSEAYPGRIGPVEYRNGDWTFLIGSRRFYYAEGRILPEERRSIFTDYRALGFNFNYPVELPSWESGAEQRAARTRSYEESRNRQTPPAPRAEPRPVIRRSNYFFEALWNLSTRDEAWAQQTQVNFLGRTITVHSGISQKVSRINEIIMEESGRNPAVRQWISSLGNITGWNWRNVASSGNRSFHSYGIAIDILPANLRGLATYWLWTSQHDPLWWNIPYTGRWHPPDMVIKTFESFGFIWGGKWGNFDTMHFEYRPEIFVLSSIPMVNF